MNTHELAERLYQEGCNPSLYAIGSRGGASDAFCLTHNGAQWQVYYTERGHDAPPVFESGTESQACEFFFEYILSMRHGHCVGFFRSQRRSRALQAKLRAAGVYCWQDQIPYGGPSDPRYRVFVSGKAIFQAKILLGCVPVHDTGA